MTTALFLHFLAVAVGSTWAFAPRTWKSRPIALHSSSRRGATVEFTGESTTRIHVPLPRRDDGEATASKSLTAWMLSPESDRHFFGTPDVRRRGDGAWDAFQPGVDWFGLEVIPVFVIQLERSASGQRVCAVITQARSEIRSGGDSLTGRLVGRVMEHSTFRGANAVAWRENQEGWTLQADLVLTLSIPLPRFAPLPPGFASIGSRIVKMTCKRRLETFVVNLQQAYTEWAERN